MNRYLSTLLLLGMSGLATAASAADPLQFRIDEGQQLNAFYRQGPVAAHLLLNSGLKPRVLVAFPAGNSGVGIWFEDAAAPVQWTFGKTEELQERDAQGRTLHGIVSEVSVDANRLVVRDAVLGSVRVLRDFQLGIAYPASVATAAKTSAHGVRWARPRIDGAAGYAIAIDLTDGVVSGGNGAPLVLTPTRTGAPLRMRITALTGEKPLAPLTSDHLFTPRAGDDPRSREVLQFLSFEEKFLAGSWRFDTYFGRDTLMSLRLLMPALQPDAIEAGLGSVLQRMNAQGDVAHEEDIGEFAVLRRRKDPTLAQTPADAPIYDYGMIDDDRMLAPVVAAYLLDVDAGRERAGAFLARETDAGEPLGAALARNFAFVVDSAQAFARDPVATNLIALKPGRRTGQWRDSENGLGGGRFAYDVNAVLMPAALEAIARIAQTGLLSQYVTPEQRRTLAGASELAATWTKQAPRWFGVARSAADARREVADYARREGIDPRLPLASVPREGLRFNALALDAAGKPVPVLNSDIGFALLFLDPEHSALEEMVASVMRPFPVGLMTDVGLLVANPAFAADDVKAMLGRSDYHGTVVWSWQQALMAAGLQRQLERKDLPDTTRSHLRDARARLWRAIDATRATRTSELWSWSYADGRYRVAPFGQNSGDADESNAAQLWSTVYLAIPPPAP